MKKLLLPLLGLCTVMLMVQCDKIEPPFKEAGEQKVAADTPYFETETSFIQKYLLEDYTGHTCLNCPKAHTIMKEMRQAMGDTLVCMAVHCGNFAEPGDAPFTADYRTALGNYLAGHFSVSGLPKGMISRKLFNGKRVLDRSEWKSSAASLPRTAPELGLQIKDTTVAAYPDSVYIFVKINYLKDFTSSLRLHVVLLEDSIVSAQKQPDLTVVENYVHDHMLRACLSPLEGSVLHAGNAVAQGTAEIRAYALHRNPTWRWKHCSILAFITDAESEEVLQAEHYQVRP